MTSRDRSRRRTEWVRLIVIEGVVAAIGALALVALVAVIDERTRSLMPFIPH